MGKVLTASDFQHFLENEELERIVENVEAFGGGAVRLVKLDPHSFLQILALRNEIEKDEEGKVVHEHDAIKFAATLLSKTILDTEGNRPFDTDKGRLFLARMNVNSQSQLVNEAIDLCGLGPGQLDNKIAAAKKN